MDVYAKEFDKWNIAKKVINLSSDKVPYFSIREVWWVKIGVNIGHEIDGKGVQFARPVLIIKKVTKNSFIGIPLTSRFHLYFSEVECSIQTGKTSYLLISQVRCFSSKRFVNKLGVVKNEQFETILNTLCRFLNEKG